MGIHVGHLALQVEDIEAATHFAVDCIGLRKVDSSPDLHLFTANDKHHEFELIPSAAAGMDHLGIEVDSAAELEAIRHRVEDAGGEILEDLDPSGFESGFRAVGPGDFVVELYVGMTRDPMSVENGLRGPIRRFGHVNVMTPEQPELVAWLTAAIGLRVSDTLGDDRAWLRCDSEHHGVVVGPDETNRLHHYAFELTDWSAMRDYLDRLIPLGIRQLWGPSRHGPGFNIAAYCRDPSGCVLEAYTDMQHIENDGTYVPVDWSQVEGARNLWGPEAGPGFRADNGIPMLAPARAAGEAR